MSKHTAVCSFFFQRKGFERVLRGKKAAFEDHTFVTMEERPLILFDGVCNFCNYWVNFAIRHDRKKKLRFTSLQGETAAALLPGYSIQPTDLSSVILIDKGKAYTQSSASIRICKYLDGGWKLFYGLMIIPKFIRDLFYNIIARHRYKWFGKKETCMIPPPGWKERFLD